MSRRLSEVRSTATNIALAVLVMLVMFGCGKTSSTPTNSTPSTPTNSTPTNSNSTNVPANKDVAANDDKTGIAVPDGKPAEILAFAKKLTERRPELSSPQERDEYIQSVQRAMIEAGDKILAQGADDEILREAAMMKMVSLMILAERPDQPPAQAQAAGKNALRQINRLREDQRKVVADVGNDFLVAGRALNVHLMSSSEQKRLVNDAIQAVEDTAFSPPAVRNANFLVTKLMKIGQTGLAASFCERMADLLQHSTEKKQKMMAARFRSRANRMRLPGNKMELEGKSVDGGAFDWQSYRGKVVLVDFWATWCGPCVAELPNVEAVYDEYHSRGFDVVGISLDIDREKLVEFLKTHRLPWVQLFEDPDPDNKEQSHPMADKYDIATIPAAFLVDREGKVVSVDARGPELKRQLRKLFDEDR